MIRAAASYATVAMAPVEALVSDPVGGDNTLATGFETMTPLSDGGFWSQVLLLVGYGTMFVLCLALIAYMRYNRNVAFRGDATAARKIILPAFEPLLWILTVTTGIYTGFFVTTISTDAYKAHPSKRDNEMFYAGWQFVFLVVVVFMMQKSVSLPALRRTVLIALVLSTYTIPIVWILWLHYEPTSAAIYWPTVSSRAIVQLFVVYVFVRPPARASRISLRQFCAFVLVYYGCTQVSLALVLFGLPSKSEISRSVAMCWAALAPLLIWRVLKADTEYWRGMGQRACSLQHMTRQQAVIDERISSRGLHVLIEMHRKYVIDFAHLELKKRIGAGVNSIVFKGVLSSTTHVAAKVYTPRNFTEETIATFSHEAALCATLHHPNIVKFYGMCICPPTVCLVSELCLGNLEDVVTAISSRGRPPQRQQNIIDLGYMIDAARALAYIHSFSPPFLHRDVKPANFLVDDERNVKLTDFGESRSLPRHHRPAETAVALPKREAIAAVQPMLKMTVTGTVDYMAPELINGRSGLASYGEAADVYSLAITFWDILNPGGERYPAERSNMMKIFETVIDGTRPDLDTSIHPQLRKLIAKAWHTDPSLRPTAQLIVTQLEHIQEELLAPFASELCGMEFDQSGLSLQSPHLSHDKIFTGEYAIERMEDCKYVATVGEGIRLGNALMDAGFLHHLSHEQGFVNSDAIYFFDDDNVRLCQPFAILEADTTENSNSSSNAESEREHLEILSAAAPKRKASLSAGPKHIMSHFTSSFTSTLTASGRSASKTSIFTGGSGGSDFANSSMGEGGNSCQCRRYAQRLEPLSHPARRRHRRNQPQRRMCSLILEEENPLELKLLGDTDDEDDRVVPSSLHKGRSGSSDSNSGSQQKPHISISIAA